jgi:hypothetical protein
VINAGRQPIAITEVGLAERRRDLRSWRLLRGSNTALTLRKGGVVIETGESWPALDDEDEPIVLQPGDLKTFILIETDEPRLSDVQTPVYAFAEDALGHRSWDRFEVSPRQQMASWIKADCAPEAYFE